MLKRQKHKRLSYLMTIVTFVIWSAVHSSPLPAGEQDEGENQHPGRQLAPVDSDLELRVKEVLSEDPTVESHEIIVIVECGEAYLYGAVDSEREKKRAEKVTSEVEGVISVKNQLTVASALSLADKKDPEIEKSTREALAKALGRQADLIEVLVQHGMATLEGKVETRAELRRAIETAFESGAVLVKNELEVRDEAKKPK
jgi:osmotically-inducible protein OsmY